MMIGILVLDGCVVTFGTSRRDWAGLMMTGTQALKGCENIKV